MLPGVPYARNDLVRVYGFKLHSIKQVSSLSEPFFYNLHYG
jgi:hypothetical protein